MLDFWGVDFSFRIFLILQGLAKDWGGGKMFFSTTKLVSNPGTLLILSLLSDDFRCVAFVGNGFHGFRFQT